MNTSARRSGPPPGISYGPGEGRARYSRQARDIFPLPRIHVPTAPGSRGRGQQQRNSRAQRTATDVNDAIDSLNLLAGYAASSWPTPGSADSLQKDVIARIDRGVRYFTPDAECQPYTRKPEAAFSELLRGRGVYDHDPANVNLAPFEHTKIHEGIIASRRRGVS